MSRFQQFETDLRAAADELSRERISREVDARIRSRMERRRPRRRRMLWTLPAAAACAAALALLLVRRPAAPPATVVGGLRLADASASARVRLDAEQAVSVEGGPCRLFDDAGQAEFAVDRPARLRREPGGVRVLSGEVEVRVARRPAGAAARVLVSGGVIEVLGTRFQIVQRAEGGRVSLLEGRIRFVASAGEAFELEPGESLAWPVPPRAAPPVPSPPPLEPAPRAPAPPSRPKPNAAPAAQSTSPRPAPAAPPGAASNEDELAIFERVGALRSRGRYEEAVRELGAELARAGSASRRERLSFELGSILSFQLRQRERACAHWAEHRRAFPRGTYAQEVAQAMEQEGCP